MTEIIWDNCNFYKSVFEKFHSIELLTTWDSHIELLNSDTNHFNAVVTKNSSP